MIIKTTAAVISLAPYLTYKGEHTTLSKIKKNNCFVAEREGRGWGSGGRHTNTDITASQTLRLTNPQ